MFIVGEQSFTAWSGGFVIGAHTVSPGGTAVTVDGTAMSLGISGVLDIRTLSTVLPSERGVGGGAGGPGPTNFGGVVVEGCGVSYNRTGSVKGFTGDGRLLLRQRY